MPSTAARCSWRPVCPRRIAPRGKWIVGCLKRGRKLFSCGNEGSGADVMQLAQELVGRYKANRRALPAICLNSDVTALTCFGNDHGFDRIFARPLSAFAQPGDVLVGFGPGGDSPNVLAASRSRGR